jgi:hypothetical protein
MMRELLEWLKAVGILAVIWLCLVVVFAMDAR